MICAAVELREFLRENEQRRQVQSSTGKNEKPAQRQSQEMYDDGFYQIGCHLYFSAFWKCFGFINIHIIYFKSKGKIIAFLCFILASVWPPIGSLAPYINIYMCRHTVSKLSSTIRVFPWRAWSNIIYEEMP